MATPRSSTDGVRRSGRNISHPLVRRSTKGPLDSAEDPLHGPNASSSADPVQPPDIVVDPSSTPTTPVHHHEHARREEHTTPPIDLRFLQDRRSYHKITHDEIPQSFLKSARQPVLGTPLADLLQGGHFRRAAETALDDLLHISLSRPDQLLQLLYCRLACLVLIGRLDFAADEAVMLYDFLNSNASDAREALDYVPWELRVLLSRLQLFSAQDGGRRGIMALYALANEVRSHIRAAREPETVSLWQQRLKEIGWRVADALVEMGELETAVRHLDSLQDDNQDEILARKALLHIHTGNIDAARSCVDKLSDEHIQLVLETLLTSVEGQADEGLRVWHNLSQPGATAQLAIQNEAIFLLYAGRITEARTALKAAVADLPVNATMLFNLSTIYELCSDKATLQKLQLAEDLAQKVPSPMTGGWERSNVELKL